MRVMSPLVALGIRHGEILVNSDSELGHVPVVATVFGL